jgi:dTMP kinase
MLITFEGIDLSGKSTQAKLLYDYLKKKRKKVILVREPGGTIISEKIRKILLDKKNDKMEYLTEFLLFSASRHQLTEEVIKPHLKKGYWVICDRYYHSSTAYQGYGGQISLRLIYNINKIATGNLKPDLSFLIDINYDENLKRRKKMNKSHDRIEKKENSYYYKVITGYRKLAFMTKRFIKIDGTLPIETIHNKILKYLLKQK